MAIGLKRYRNNHYSKSRPYATNVIFIQIILFSFYIANIITCIPYTLGAN